MIECVGHNLVTVGHSNEFGREVISYVDFAGVRSGDRMR